MQCNVQCRVFCTRMYEYARTCMYNAYVKEHCILLSLRQTQLQKSQLRETTRFTQPKAKTVSDYTTPKFVTSPKKLPPIANLNRCNIM